MMAQIMESPMMQVGREGEVFVNASLPKFVVSFFVCGFRT